MGRLVEPLGASDLASARKSPLTQPAEEAAILEAVRRKGQGFGDVGTHPALVKTLCELFRELRAAELDSRRLAELGSWGLMAEVALAVCPESLDAIRAANLYDDHDLFASAPAALSGTRIARLVNEVGSVLVYLPAGQTPAETRFLKALSVHTSIDIALTCLEDGIADRPSEAIAQALGLNWGEQPAAPAKVPQVSLLAAPEAAEQVRTVVRRLLGYLEQGVELSRAAVVYRDQDPYGPLVRDTLDAAGVPWAGIDGRPLSESWAGRGLLGLLRLRERDFARVDVLACLGALPEVDPGHVSIGDWDRLSRRAAVVRGARQWRGRLRVPASQGWGGAGGTEEARAGAGAVPSS